MIGMPTYGRGFTLADASNNGFNAPTTGASPAGAWTGEAGFISYYEVRARLVFSSLVGIPEQLWLDDLLSSCVLMTSLSSCGLMTSLSSCVLMTSLSSCGLMTSFSSCVLMTSLSSCV